MRSGSGPLFEVVEWAARNCRLAMTEETKDHWRRHVGSNDHYFWEWYGTQVEANHVHVIPSPTRLDGRTWRQLKARYGLPDDCFVRRYIECANTTSQPRYILAEDMDLHDPPSRALDTRHQEQIRETRRGPLCRAIESRFRIRVGTVADFIDVFSASSGQCTAKPNGGPCRCTH